MKQYLSYGGGVNSTALLLLLKEKNIDFETIFVNHETDKPQTYEYIKYLKNKGFKITEIKPNFQGYSSLYEYCYDKKFLPSIYLRWCTYRFKLQPIWEYVKVPCIMYVGIAFNERKRAFDSYKKNKKVKQIKIKYPLIEQHLTRKDCIKIIKQHNLRVPEKSGCFICPFMKPKYVKELYLKDRRLYEKLKQLEIQRGNKHTLLKRPISYYAPENMPNLNKYMGVKLNSSQD